MAAREIRPSDLSGGAEAEAEQDSAVRILDSTEHRTAAGTPFLRFDGRVGEERFYAHAPLNRDGALIVQADVAVLHGYSMGGMAAYNLSGGGLLRGLAGVVVVNGTVDSLASNSLPAIREAYGAADDGELLRRQAGYDPARDDPARWAGIPMFLSYSTGDAAVPAQRHGEVFVGRAATPERIVYRVGTNGHADVAGFRHPEVLAWIESLPPLAFG
ncbi:hypothetical protein ACL90Y_01195 [Micrococcus luteus]